MSIYLENKNKIERFREENPRPTSKLIKAFLEKDLGVDSSLIENPSRFLSEIEQELTQEEYVDDLDLPYETEGIEVTDIEPQNKQTSWESVISIDPSIKKKGELITITEIGLSLSSAISKMLEFSDNATAYVYVSRGDGFVRVDKYNGFTDLENSKQQRRLFDITRKIYESKFNLGSYESSLSSTDARQDVLLKVALIPNELPKKKFNYLRENPNYNCFIKIVRDNTARKERYENKCDAFNRVYFKRGVDMETVKIILDAVELNVDFYDILGNLFYSYNTGRTKKKISLLVHNDHASKAVNFNLMSNYKKVEHEIVSSEFINSLKDTGGNYEYYEFSSGDELLIGEEKAYKTYTPIGIETAISLSNELKTYFREYRNLPSFRLDNVIKPLSLQTIEGRDVKPQDYKRVDKINSYRSSIIHPMHRGYPTLLREYKTPNQDLAFDFIELYEGMALICPDLGGELSKYPYNLIFPEGKCYYPFNLVRYYLSLGLPRSFLKILSIYVSFKSERNVYPKIFLRNTSESNEYFCLLNGSLHPRHKVKYFSTKNKEEFLAILQEIHNKGHIVQDIDYGDLFSSVQVSISDFNILVGQKKEGVKIKHSGSEYSYYIKYTELSESYGRSDIYSYNLAYTRIDIINKLFKIPEDRLIAVKTDSITYTFQRSIYEMTEDFDFVLSGVEPLSELDIFSEGEVIEKKDKYVKTGSKCREFKGLGKWQVEEIKEGSFSQVIHGMRPIEFISVKDKRFATKIEPTILRLPNLDKKNKRRVEKIYKNLGKDIFITGPAGSGKSYFSERLGLPSLNTSSLRATPKEGEVSKKTSQGVFRYFPTDETAETWDFSEMIPTLDDNIIIIDECFRLGRKFIDDIRKRHPYHSFIFVGDTYQICPSGYMDLAKEKNCLVFDFYGQNYRFKEDPEFYKLLELVRKKVDFVEPRTEFKSINDKIEYLIELNEYMESEIRQFKRKNKIFRDLFEKKRSSDSIYIAPTNDQVKLAGSFYKEAYTIMKSQGKTINSPLVVDTFKIKDWRTLYVAMSRVTRADLLRLVSISV